MLAQVTLKRCPTLKQHNAENETMLSLCHYVNSYSPEGTTNMSTFYLHYSSSTFSYFLHWNNAFFSAFITKIL